MVLLLLFAAGSSLQAVARGVKYAAETVSAGGSEVGLQLEGFRKLSRHVPDGVRRVSMQTSMDRAGLSPLRFAQRAFAPRIVLPDGGGEWLIAPADAVLPARFERIAVSGEYALYAPVPQ